MKRTACSISLFFLLFSAAFSVAAQTAYFRMEGARYTKTDTYTSPVWDTITLANTYVNPVVFIIPSTDGNNSADFRIRNITSTSFQTTTVEPPPWDGPHVAMTVSYLVCEVGNWFLTPDIMISVGVVETSNLVNSQGGTWITVPLPQGFSNPIVLAQIQGMANELNNPPSQPSRPWVTAAVRNVTSDSFEVALDGGRCTNVSTSPSADCRGPYTLLPERIAYLVIESGINATFTDADGRSIKVASIKTPRNIVGYSDGGTVVNFGTTFAQTPLFVAKPQTRYEDDGGWFRFNTLTTSSVRLMVEEALGDTTNTRYHTSGEVGGLLMFSGNFRVLDLDPDRDLVPVPYDNCPDIWNHGQEDVNSNGVGDACDCGDGIVASIETCDDGNNMSGDGCSAACGFELGWECAGSPSVCDGICGDGLELGSETCDDGNTVAGDGCSSACYTEAGWDCSSGTCVAICGDGRILGMETCDDGNTEAGDGCSSACFVETGWVCIHEPSVCDGLCGDGRILGMETCDDGNRTNGDGCSSTCRVESGWNCTGEPSTCSSVCGDSLVRGAEACDDGNTDPADGCAATCVVESGWNCTGEPSVCSSLCGDGLVRGSETCDDGNTASGDGCSSACTVESGWNCTGEPSVCDEIPGTCGDGRLDSGEACDDGGNDGGDGCSASCRVETGWNCAGEPSACSGICGDGLVRGSETCDDGNTDPADGCAATCVVEVGWACSGEPSVCEEVPAVCGNGNLEPGETCDDGNTAGEDGCSPECVLEPGWMCTPTGCCRDGNADGSCDQDQLGAAGSGCSCRAGKGRNRTDSLSILLLFLLGVGVARRRRLED